MQKGETNVYQSAEGEVEQSLVSLQAIEVQVREVVALGNQDALDCIPDFIEQVRVSEEHYIKEGSEIQLRLGQLAAWGARELLEKKYGPIQGLVTGALVKRGRWQW